MRTRDALPLALLGAVLLAGCSADPPPVDRSCPAGPDFQGVVEEVDGNRVRVNATAGTHKGPVWLSLEEADLRFRSGGICRKATLYEIEEGLRAEVVAPGPWKESYPPQADAAWIVFER